MTKEKAISLLRVAKFVCQVDKQSCSDAKFMKTLDEMCEAYQMAIDALESVVERTGK